MRPGRWGWTGTGKPAGQRGGGSGQARTRGYHLPLGAPTISDIADISGERRCFWQAGTGHCQLGWELAPIATHRHDLDTQLRIRVAPVASYRAIPPRCACQQPQHDRFRQFPADQLTGSAPEDALGRGVDVRDAGDPHASTLVACTADQCADQEPSTGATNRPERDRDPSANLQMKPAGPCPHPGRGHARYGKDASCQRSPSARKTMQTSRSTTDTTGPATRRPYPRLPAQLPLPVRKQERVLLEAGYRVIT